MTGIGSLCVAGLLALSAGAETFEIGEALSEEAFWKSDPVLFVRRHQDQGFKFTSEDRTASDSRREGGVTCFGIPVFETRVAFGAEGGIDRVELMLFNRGGVERVEEIRMADGRLMRRVRRVDKGMSREGFFRAVSDLQAKLTAPGAKPPRVTDERTTDVSVRQCSQLWPKTALPTVASLLWNYAQDGKREETFRPGFIRLSVDGPARVAAAKGRATSAKTAKGARKIAENVVRDPRGDVFVDNVPMVDQGQKGYCAVAAAERVMRYYGLEVDEHEIGEAAGTQAEGGTSVAAMRTSVERIGKRYRLATVLLCGDLDDDTQKRIANLEKEVSAYNKAAKRLKKPPIAEDVYVSRHGGLVTYSPHALDEAMDPEVLKYMKTEGGLKSKYTKFRKDVRQYVDAGMPLYWSVLLGVYPEGDLPQAKGGHMRLIIGYNDKKDEILYTDSWGKGHELKRMPAGWAWTITRCVMAMKPLR